MAFCLIKWIKIKQLIMRKSTRLKILLTFLRLKLSNKDKFYEFLYCFRFWKTKWIDTKDSWEFIWRNFINLHCISDKSWLILTNMPRWSLSPFNFFISQRSIRSYDWVSFEFIVARIMVWQIVISFRPFFNFRHILIALITI